MWIRGRSSVIRAMASFMPKRVIMLRAMAVARSMSFAAPEVQVRCV